MINPKDINLKDPNVIKNLPKEFIQEFQDGRDPKELTKKEFSKKDIKKKGVSK